MDERPRQGERQQSPSPRARSGGREAHSRELVDDLIKLAALKLRVLATELHLLETRCHGGEVGG